MSEGLDALRESWRAKWPEALRAWSRFSRLSEPQWCMTAHEESNAGLHDTFAMFRLGDRSVVVGLARVRALGLDECATQVLAHEAGHHIHVPGDLADAARIHARVRRALPGKEALAPMVANLWADLLINDRLQRSARLDMAAVYRRLRPAEVGGAFAVYLRAYERLWSLPAGDLVGRRVSDEEDLDASFAADLARSHAATPVAGAGPFAAVLFDRLPERMPALPAFVHLCADLAGAEPPEGLVEMDADEESEPRHPGEEDQEGGAGGAGTAKIGGRKNTFRGPRDWMDLMKSVGVCLPEEDLVARYYAELARSHPLRFPPAVASLAKDVVPEGVVPWEPGSAVSRIDWLATLVRSPVVIPGVTTLEREEAVVEVPESPARPPDLYLGVDCSGSMSNPAFTVSYPVLAAVVLGKAALRAGARVMATLSGEPGSHASTPGFVRDERAMLRVLTSYLGTGYSFGVERLRETFLARHDYRVPVRIFLVTDSDFFRMLDATPDGWEVAAKVAEAAGGGAVAALDRCPAGTWLREMKALDARGWAVRPVSTAGDLVALARAAGRDLYAPRGRRGPAK